jgi:hypothetical protein
MSLMLVMLLATQRPVYAIGSWAALDRGADCTAVARSTRIVQKRSEQASTTITFDRTGQRRGELAFRLGHPARPGTTVMLTIGSQPFLLASNGLFAWSRGPAQESAILTAMRTADAMRIDAHSPGGTHFSDLYTLDGAPGAIDAAAVCALHR